jgi:predicted transcriptional regulator
MLLGRLTEEQSEVMILRFLEGYSISEVAEMLDKSEGAVKSLQSRAISTLRQLTGADEVEVKPDKPTENSDKVLSRQERLEIKRQKEKQELEMRRAQRRQELSNAPVEIVVEPEKPKVPIHGIDSMMFDYVFSRLDMSLQHFVRTLVSNNLDRTTTAKTLNLKPAAVTKNIKSMYTQIQRDLITHNITLENIQLYEMLQYYLKD